MATTLDYIEFVMEQLEDYRFEFHYKKMFGEYCVYANGKPILLVCDNTVYVKMLSCLAQQMIDSRVGIPYEGAKPHYLLDIEDRELVSQVIPILEENVPLSKHRKSKAEH